MRILVLSSYFYPNFGGSQKYMEELYAHLVQADKSVQVDVVCYNTNNALSQEKYRGLNIYRIPCIQILPGQFALPNYFSLIKLINQLVHKYHYDIVHSNTRFFDHSWWAPFLARMIGAKSILTDHCSSHPIHNSKIVTLVSSFIDNLGSLICGRFYDSIMVTNKATLKFAKSIHLGSPQVVYGGVDTELFKPRSSLKLTKKDIMITFSARMISTKGPQLLLEAAQDLIKKYPHIKFFFAGDGSLYKKLAPYASSQIHFLGALNQAQIRKLLAKSDIFVHPSSHHEGFPNSILEAGASGCAVIATNKGGTNELIKDGITGIIIQPNVKSLEQAIIKLIQDKKLRNNLGKALRQKIVKEFDWQIIVKQFQKKIQDIQSLDKVKSMNYYRIYK